MHLVQLANERKLRFDPMDDCSIKLLQIISLLSIQGNSTRETAILLSDIPATILFAAGRADGFAPLQSQIFQNIVKQIAVVQEPQGTYKHLLQKAPHSLVSEVLQECGTREGIKATIKNAGYLLGLSQVLRATPDVIILVLHFIDEWSDILSGADVLDGCSSVKDPSPYIEDDREVWKNSVRMLDGLSFDNKAQLASAMPMWFSQESVEVCCTELLSYEDGKDPYRRFREREEKRCQHVCLTTLGQPL